jgi:hypothetical protein
MTTSSETLNCHVDKEVVLKVAAWRPAHSMQPPRRMANTEQSVLAPVQTGAVS